MSKQKTSPPRVTPAQGSAPTGEAVPQLPDFSRLLLDWYRQNRRRLPWRENPTPYRVWVSEIMLQQTRVEAVKPYFARFMEELPDVRALAACPPDRLNKLWEGLGYYSRVRNLQKAAQTVVDEYDGEIPSSPSLLLRLPGVGSYTAGAIASFAFGVPAPAVDGNVLRVLARVLGDERNILDPSVKRDYEAAVLRAIPEKEAGDYNQALIEIGATVCGPNLPPQCDSCPLAGFCRAHLDRLTDRIPVREKKKPRKVQDRTVLLVRDGSHTLLHRRPDKGLLAGLYEFPALEGAPEEAELLRFVRGLGLEPLRISPLGAAKHIFTHVEWRMQGYEVMIADTALPVGEPLSLSSAKGQTAPKSLSPAPGGAYVFADTAALTDRYAIPSAYAAYLKCLQVEKGSKRLKRQAAQTE